MARFIFFPREPLATGSPPLASFSGGPLPGQLAPYVSRIIDDNREKNQLARPGAKNWRDDFRSRSNETKSTKVRTGSKVTFDGRRFARDTIARTQSRPPEPGRVSNPKEARF